MFTKICKFCGKEFKTKYGRKIYCDRKHTKMCIICGKEFEIPYNRLGESDSRRTCSKECESILRKNTNIIKYGGVAPASSKEVQSKMKATSLQRYGVEIPACCDEIKEKIMCTNRERYGVDYYSQSEQWVDSVIATNQERYGTDWATQSDKTKQKTIDTCQLKYGVDNPMQYPEIQQRFSDSYFHRTGYAYPAQNPEVKCKTKKTSLQVYGTEYPMQSKQCKDKSIQTNIARYGVPNPMQNLEIARRSQDTTFKRYGHRCFLQSDTGRQLLKSSMQKLYGVDYFSQSTEWLKQHMLNPNNINKFLEFKSDPTRFICTYYNYKPNLKELSSDLGIHINTLGQYILSNHLESYISYTLSYMEVDVYDTILSICPKIIIEQNTHKIITPKEIDIYLPEFKIGIECNPTATHNSTIGIFDKSNKSNKLSPSYHKMKTDMAEKVGVFLFHIYGYEWTHKRDIIISMLRNLLGCNTTKIYGRKTNIKEVSAKDARIFLNENHRQGYAASSIRYGLYYNGELVSLMTFGKMRSTIGKSSGDGCYELVRFCNKLNTSVIGGASKLFKHFISTLDPNYVISFSDRSHTRGNLYKTLGFKEIRRSDPGYVWVRLEDDRAYHRINAQKQNIKRFLKDDSIDLSKSESTIMAEHGFVQVFDSGTIVWEYRKR